MNEILTDIPVIKTFILNNCCFFYDVYANQLLKVSKGIFFEICELEKLGVSAYKAQNKISDEYRDVLLLMEKGLLQSDFIEEVIHPDTENIDNLLNRCVNQLVMEVTEGCNFQCKYCIQDPNLKMKSKKMNVETAQRSVDFLFDHSKDAQEVSITFYGGEPLLNMKLIESVVTYANSKFKTKEIFYNITTNASLLTNDIIAFFVNNRFSMLISLDGEEKTQNYHRKFQKNGADTFNIVWKNILNIRERYPDYFQNNVRFNAVILPDENSNDVRAFFGKNGISKDAFEITNADMSGIEYKFNRYNIRRNTDIADSVLSAVEYSDLLEKFNKKDIIPAKWHHNGPCVPGVRRLFVSTDGYFYPCEKVNKASACMIGSLDTGIDIALVSRILNVGKITEKECKHCWAARFCTLCVKQCIDDNVISYEKKITSCKWIKEKALNFLKEYAESKMEG